jgi:quinol monooxygenase YgiN
VFAIIARFKVRPGHVDEVIELLNQAAIPSRAEPGCHFYVANRSLDDPDLIVMYEQYESAEAFQAHIDTDHFREIVAGKVVPLLESRQRETYSVVTAG